MSLDANLVVRDGQLLNDLSLAVNSTDSLNQLAAIGGGDAPLAQNDFLRLEQ
jgi:hypothetical protein